MNTRAGDTDNTLVKRTEFSSVYTLLRQREKRMYSNAELRSLPRVKHSDPHFAEWKLRARSARRLLSYIEGKQKPLRILEVGCGNGWLANKISAIPGCHVTGIDPHGIEILQAREVFKENRHLEFVETDLVNYLNQLCFDLIVFAASLQYFEDLNKAMTQAMSLLNEDGEIHILDTQFYSKEERSQAAFRSEQHFNKVNVPEMAGHYHHHSFAMLEAFSPEILYAPNKLLRGLGFKLNPFPWIRIRK